MMKKIVPFIFILSSLIILFLVVLIIINPPAPVFSHPSGYYQEPFSLSISSNTQNVTIHYTLDGSIPTIDSPIYTEPLSINDRSSEPNSFSMIPTTSYRFVEPKENLFKISIVRARSFNNLTKAPSPIITQSYFVHEDIHGLYTLPIISLVVDPKDFFDKEVGIYVTGEDEEITAEDGEDFFLWHANYQERGKDWEKPVHIEYFSVDGELLFSQNSGARIHGVATRSFPQKSFRLYARKEYDDQEKFPNKIFPDLVNINGEKINDFETLILRNGGDDVYSSFFRDVLTQKLVQHTSVGTQAASPVIVFLNGEYWGIYFLYERYDENYFLNHYGIKPENLIVLENKGVVVIGAEKERQVYQDLLYYVLDNDTQDQKVYTEISKQIDINNFIDYQITEIFIAHQDWPDNNIKFWRTRITKIDPDNSYGQDGRWRWLLFDTDNGFKRVELNSIAYATRTDLETILLRSLLKNPDFTISFLNRFADHINTTFKPERVIQEIDHFEAIFSPEMQEQIDRWNSSGSSFDKWKENVEDLRLFANERPEIMIRHLVRYFELEGTFTLSVKTDTEKGTLKVNSIDISTATPGIYTPEFFQGVYFQDIPIMITATPLNGYEFSHWSGLGVEGVKDNPIEIISSNDIQLQPVFIPGD